MDEDQELEQEAYEDSFRDPYQALARGVAPDEDAEDNGRKFSGIARIVLIVTAIVLDILSIIEIPVADVVALVISVILFMYFFYAGASQIRMFVTWALAWAVELVPAVDLLPFYVVGMVLVILIDNSKVASTAVGYIPSKNLATRKLGSKVGNKASRLSKNAAFGRKSALTRRKTTQTLRKIDTLKKKYIPGPLRSVPGEAAIRGTYNASQRLSGSSDTPVPNTSGRDDMPLPDYDTYSRPFLPELEDLTADVDVTGEKAAEEAARKLAGGPSATERVQ